MSVEVEGAQKNAVTVYSERGLSFANVVLTTWGVTGSLAFKRDILYKFPTKYKSDFFFFQQEFFFLFILHAVNLLLYKVRRNFHIATSTIK